MFRTLIGRTLFLLSLTLLLVLTFGVVVSHGKGAPSGGGNIVDGNALSDQVTVKMSGIPRIKAALALEGWLVSDDGSVKLSLGILEVDEDGNVSHTFTSPDGENLIALYDKLVITVEPVPDSDPGPSAVVYAIHTLPSGALNHIRHMLFWWPPQEGEKGIMTNLKEQLGVGITHANLALGSNDLDGVKLHAHHVVNILEGLDGDNFDGSFGNPGKGLDPKERGAFLHATDRKHAGFAEAAAEGDATVALHATHVLDTGKNAEDWATLARDKALLAIGATSFSAAKGYSEEASALLQSALEGIDANGDGAIAPIIGEGGAETAYVHTQLMATYTLEFPEIQIPIVGDNLLPSLPVLALIVSLVTMATGGALLLRRRAVGSR